MCKEEKCQHMVKWWEGNMDLFSKMGLQREDYGRVVLGSRLLFRHGITELMGLTSKLDLPFFIVSGGIAEIIEASFYAILHNGETGDLED
jgi:2-hydroxy-3-keto-5-methylthiopentenyl-1-phosphate phosphatase